MSEPQSTDVLFERAHGVHALQVMQGVAHVVITLAGGESRADQILSLFEALAQAGVPVFLTKLHSSSVTLAVDDVTLAAAEQALAQVGLTADTTRGLTVVSVQAASMRELSGVMADIADTLGRVGARLYETGDSHNSVQCLIDSALLENVVRALCSTFQLSEGAVGLCKPEAA